MCFICCSSLTNEQVVKQLKNQIETNYINFEIYNTTSVQGILYASIGIFGLEAKTLAINILEKFISWLKINKKDNYIPNTGFESMYKHSTLQILLDFCQQNKKMAINEQDKHDLYKILFKKLIQCSHL